MEKDEETEIAVECSVLDIRFSFDVGRSMFDVRRSSFKTRFGFLINADQRVDPVNAVNKLLSNVFSILILFM